MALNTDTPTERMNASLRGRGVEEATISRMKAEKVGLTGLFLLLGGSPQYWVACTIRLRVHVVMHVPA